MYGDKERLYDAREEGDGWEARELYDWGAAATAVVVVARGEAVGVTRRERRTRFCEAREGDWGVDGNARCCGCGCEPADHDS